MGIGESCAASKCCDWSGYQCFEKNTSWSSCLMDCIPGKPNGGISNKQIVQAGFPDNDPLKKVVPVLLGDGPQGLDLQAPHAANDTRLAGGHLPLLLHRGPLQQRWQEGHSRV